MLFLLLKLSKSSFFFFPCFLPYFSIDCSLNWMKKCLSQPPRLLNNKQYYFIGLSYILCNSNFPSNWRQRAGLEISAKISSIWREFRILHSMISRNFCKKKKEKNKNIHISRKKMEKLSRSCYVMLCIWTLAGHENRFPWPLNMT